MNDYEIRGKLRQRFYVSSQNGSTRKFYDTLTKKDGLSLGSIQGAVISMYDTEKTYNQAKEIVKATHFDTIAPHKLYRVNKPKIITEDGIHFLNKWVKPEFPKDSSAKDARPFINHLADVLGSQEKADYLIDVLAYRMQNPYEDKPHVAFYFYHEQGGCGKTTFVNTLKAVLGKNSVKILNTSNALKSMSQVEVWQTSWLIVEEAAITKGSDVYDKIKSFTGNDTVDSDVKHAGFSDYETPAMLMMMSNRPPSFIEWHLDMNADDKQDYFHRYIDWLNSGGYKAINKLLRERKVTQDVRKVPVTKEKEKAMQMSVAPEVIAVKDFLADETSEYWFFNEKAFDEIWREHSVNTNRRKHILSEAGLDIPKGRTKVEERQYRLYSRKGAMIEYRPPRGNAGVYLGEEKPLKDVAMIKSDELEQL